MVSAVFLPAPPSTSSPLNPRAGDAQLLAMWRRGLPPSARGALWSMAVGNTLGLTDEDFDVKVAAAEAYAVSLAAAADAGSGCAGEGGVSDDCSRSAVEKRENESILRAQIEMDLQRTMPRYWYSRREAS